MTYPAPIVVQGIGETGPSAADPRSIAEMVLDAVEAALSDGGVGWGDIDAVVTASVDLFDGLTASSIAVTEVVGAVLKPETRIAADGLAAAIHAVCQVRAEAYRTVLVVAHGKASMVPFWDLTAWAVDPIFLQPLGVDFRVFAGLQAAAVGRDDPGAIRRWAELAATRRRAAGDAGLGGPCTAEEILASRVLASPLREEMCAPLGDGAVAVVLGVRPSVAGSGDVVIAGTGHDLSSHYPGERDLSGWPGLDRAFKRACGLAGIEDPAVAFDLAEPSCLFPHEEELFLSATGLRDSTPIAPGGGLFAGAVPVAAGLSRLASAVRGIREGRARRALAHGTWGPAGQGQAVAVLEAL